MPKVEQRNTTTFHLQYIGKEISTSLPFISVMASSCFRRTLQYNCCTTRHCCNYNVATVTSVRAPKSNYLVLTFLARSDVTVAIL